MKLRLLHNLFYCILFFCFTSCVSKKKYVGLEKSYTQVVTKEAQGNIELAKLSTGNDSLKTELIKRDSIIDSLAVIISAFQAKKEKPKVYSQKNLLLFPKNLSMKENHNLFTISLRILNGLSFSTEQTL